MNQPLVGTGGGGSDFFDPGSGGDDDGDELLEFIQDVIYDNERSRGPEKTAQALANQYAPVFAKLIRGLGITYSQIAGGYADSSSFSFELQDEEENSTGKEVVGDRNSAKISEFKQAK